MSDSHPIFDLLARDRRYKLEAYQFVRDALAFAQEVLAMSGKGSEGSEPAEGEEKHLSGQQLCEAIRQYAMEQYGYLAKAVLNSWGIRTTSDFGEIVYNMIEIELMKKSKSDRREDFDNVYDFDEAFLQGFQISTRE